MRTMKQRVSRWGGVCGSSLLVPVAASVVALLIGAGHAHAQPTTPKKSYYEQKPAAPAKPLPALDLRGKSPRDAVGEILKRRDMRTSGDTPQVPLRMAGCLNCHASLENMTVGEFSHHVETRQSYYRRRYEGAVVGVDLLATAGQTEATGQEQLKQSIDASGQNVRPAGSMATEMAREKWEAAKREAAAQEAQESRSDWEKATELISQGKYELALVPLKAHVAKQIAEEKAAIERAKDAMKKAEAGADDAKVAGDVAPSANGSTPGGSGDAEKGAEKGAESAARTAELEDTKRLLAFVLVAARQPDAGSAVVREMYRSDPRLARRPFAAADFGISEHQLGEVFASSVAFGHRAKTGSSWLMAAMLAQSEGKLPLARKLIDRGVENGLERDIADAFAVAIDEAIDAGRAKAPGRQKPEVSAAAKKPLPTQK